MPDVAESARREIDDERADLLEALRRLNSRRNSLVPVAQLAPELLTQIFMLNTLFDYPPQNTAFRVAPTLKNCSHVCQYWRRVVLACPALWSRSLNLHMETPEWTSEILKRSNPMPLDIHADSAIGAASSIYDNVDLALDHVPRLRVLNLWAPVFVMSRLVKKLNKAAPSLEELSLHNSTDANIFDVPASLFASHTSRLRRLELLNCNLRWDSPMLRGLTHLQLSGMSPCARPTFATLLSTLSQMSMLETLSLSHILPLSDVLETSFPKIHLPMLAQLRLEDGIIGCTTVLDHLIFPPTIILHLNCWASRPRSDYSAILTLIHTKFCANLLERVHIRCTSQEISVEGWTTSDDDFDFDDCFARHVFISFHWGWDITDNDIDRIPELMCATFSTLSFTRLRRLGILVDHSQIAVQDSTWDNLFSHASTVQHLRIRDPFTGPFFPLVRGQHQHQHPHAKAATPERLSLPSLRYLLIEDADFAHFASRESKCGLLLKWLDHRKRMNAPIEVVQIRSCGHIGPEVVEQLRSAVPIVKWDGVDREAFFFDDGLGFMPRHETGLEDAMIISRFEGTFFPLN